MVVIIIPYVHYHLMKAEMGLMKFSNIYSGPATCPYLPELIASIENSFTVSFQFSKSPRNLFVPVIIY